MKPRQRLPPVDFEAFWKKTVDLLEVISPRIETQLLKTTAEGLEHLQISFDSLDNARIYGYVLRHKDAQPKPLVIHSHGYESECVPQWQWAKQGLNVLGVDIRGCGTSSAAMPYQSKWGYVLTGIQQPETSALRGAICDYIRAVEAGRAFFGKEITRVVVHGFSFSGALAIMAEATLDVADLLAVGVPTFGWGEGRLFFTQAGSGAEVANFLSTREESTEDVMLVLRYFDPIHFAESVRCPTLIGLGLKDPVVPPQTVRPIASHLGVPHEVMEFPCSHTSQPEEKEWAKFDARWIQLAKEGIPPDFGK